MIVKKISNYIIKEFIAEGGMGSVYLCEHETLGWKAAVKILHPEFAVNKEVLARFKQEAKTLSELKHPNIVEILDFGVADNQPFLIMEFVEGQPLDEYIEKVTGPIGEEDAVNIMKQILYAVQEAHKKGIIHRDLKPSNVVINRKKEVKILDFGIAKKLGSDDYNKTRMGQKLGTLPYMSPEQIKGLKDISYATDIYSLGVLLHQMVTGKPPYASDLTEYDISKNVVEYPLPRVKDIYPGVKDYFQGIIDKATSKKAEDRYVSCEQFLIEVNKVFVDNSPSSESKKEVVKKSDKGSDTSTKKTKQSYIGLFVTLFLIALLVISVLSYYLVDLSNEYEYQSVQLSNVSNSKNSLQLQYNSLNYKYNSLNDKYNSLDTKFWKLEGQERIRNKFLSGSLPILIDKAKFKNVNDYSTLINNYGSTLFSSTLYYLTPKIYYVANKSSYVDIYVKIVEPSGSISKGNSSPYGYSFKSNIYCSKGKGTAELTGWGSSSGGTYSPGDYIMEFYYNSTLIGSQKFHIY